MARPIKPTPVLDLKSSATFIKRVKAVSGKSTRPIPTPKLANTLKRVAADAEKEK